MAFLPKSTQGFISSVVILLGGLALSIGKTPFLVSVIAVLTTIMMVALIQRFVKGSANEIFISGFVLGGIEAYAFLIQPNYAGLPALPGQAELFFGVAFISRAMIYLLEIIDTPLKKPIRRFLAK